MGKIKNPSGWLSIKDLDQKELDRKTVPIPRTIGRDGLGNPIWQQDARSGGASLANGEIVNLNHGYLHDDRNIGIASPGFSDMELQRMADYIYNHRPYYKEK